VFEPEQVMVRSGLPAAATGFSHHATNPGNPLQIVFPYALVRWRAAATFLNSIWPDRQNKPDKNNR
jgi:hypothetical protein